MGAYLNLKKSILLKTMEEAHKRAKKELGSDATEDDLIWTLEEESSMEIDEDKVIRLTCDAPLGYVSVDSELDIDSQIDIVELAVKRLNKFKTLLESLK